MAFVDGSETTPKNKTVPADTTTTTTNNGTATSSQLQAPSSSAKMPAPAGTLTTAGVIRIMSEQLSATASALYLAICRTLSPHNEAENKAVQFRARLTTSLRSSEGELVSLPITANATSASAYLNTITKHKVTIQLRMKPIMDLTSELMGTLTAFMDENGTVQDMSDATSSLRQAGSKVPGANSFVQEILAMLARTSSSSSSLSHFSRERSDDTSHMPRSLSYKPRKPKDDLDSSLFDDLVSSEPEENWNRRPLPPFANKSFLDDGEIIESPVLSTSSSSSSHSRRMDAITVGDGNDL